MDTLRDLLRREGSDAPLDLAALELSRIEFPHLDPQPFLDILDSYATEIDARIRMEYDALERLQVLHEFFFREQGFCGNQTDYYNPRNSCINEVIASRQGIPISLAVVYLSIADTGIATGRSGVEEVPGEGAAPAAKAPRGADSWSAAGSWATDETASVPEPPR